MSSTNQLKKIKKYKKINKKTTMNKKQELQFDKLVPHLTAISTELAEERRKKIKQFISTLLKAERGYHICPECGATAKKVNWKEYRQIKKKYNLYE